MQKELDRAIHLREVGMKKESNEVLLKLVKEFPNDASVNYQCAWSFDVLGEESNAVPFYEKAIEIGLPDNELEGAILGLGSTFRTLGEYEKSQVVFREGMEMFPKNKVIPVFYSMTLYNLKEHHHAIELLLTCLADTTTDEKILSYQRSIRYYSHRLDEIWN